MHKHGTQAKEVKLWLPSMPHLGQGRCFVPVSHSHGRRARALVSISLVMVVAAVVDVVVAVGR